MGTQQLVELCIEGFGADAIKRRVPASELKGATLQTVLDKVFKTPTTHREQLAISAMQDNMYKGHGYKAELIAGDQPLVLRSGDPISSVPEVETVPGQTPALKITIMPVGELGRYRTSGYAR